ncbi:MAG TPA: hypothetical protein VFQ15_07515 [Jiangellaceae bacterium]|nr:hypothetical protein [Jiangellaceae bacterium]
MKLEAVDKTRLARTGQEYLDLLLSDADWIVRSPADMLQLRNMGDGPLAKLSHDDFRAFVDGLEFKAGGVGGGYYKPLMSGLALTEIFEVFERFGMSREYALETHDSKCIGGTTCEFSFFSFCPTSVCQHAVEDA